MQSNINNLNFFFFKKIIIDYFLLFYLVILIFNFDNLFRKDIASFLLGSYLLLYYFFNKSSFYKIKYSSYTLIFLFYLAVNQFYHLTNISSNKISFISKDLIGMTFNLLLFSFLILLQKQWKIFFEKLFFVVCFFLVLILIQNYLILDKFILTTDIFLNYQKYNYHWASKNYLAIILNIFLIFLNLNFSKNKLYYLYFSILSISIILTLSRAGYYIYLLNLLYLIFNTKRIQSKILFIIILFILTSIFWNENSKNFYLNKKTEISYLANINSLNKITPKDEINIFSKSWFSKESKSVRVSYYFLTFDNLKENFLMGNGLGSFKIENRVLNQDGTVKRYPDTHSTWLSLLYETGFIGFLLYIFLIVKNQYFLLRKKNLSDICNFFYYLIIVFSCSLFINVLFTPIVWFLYAMRLNLNNEHKFNK
tara:strand:- start:878 stop:2146 length:1269 start_codon:yes stop_codon:yes gene_type:complete